MISTDMTLAAHDAGACRLTISGHYDAFSIGWTRIAKTSESINPTFFGAWVSDVSACYLIGKTPSDVARIAFSSSGVPTHMEMGGTVVKLQDGAVNPRSAYVDTLRWSLDSDTELSVRLAAWRKAMHVLRGPGRYINPNAIINLFVHDDIPVDYPGLENLRLRVLSLSRTDASIQTDLSASCSHRLLETTGLRFSLSTMFNACEILPNVPEKTLIQIGFDQAVSGSWLRIGDAENSVTLFNDDPILELVGTKPAIDFCKNTSVNQRGN